MRPHLLGRIVALRLTVLGNGFRRPYPAAVRGVAGLAAVIIALLLAVELATLSGDALRTASVLGGTALAGICAFLPAAVVRDDPLHPRGFVGTGVPLGRTAALLVVTDLLSFPTALLVIVLAGYIVGWAAAGAGGIALVVAVLALIGLLQLIRLSTAVGAWLWRRPRGALGRAVAWALLLASLVPVLVVAGAGGMADARAASAVGILERLGIGRVWSDPASGSPLPVLLAVAAAVVVITAVELLVIRAQLRGPRPRAPRDVPRLGMFRLVGGSPTAAIAARSWVYWLRDPRYVGSALALPFVPVLMLIAAAIGGVPGVVMALVAVPAVVLLLGWSVTHNDTAYDSTAIWTHVVAPLRGAQDRIGRIVPPLVLGILVTGVGILLVLLAVPRPGIAAVVGGLCAAALLGSLGVSSGVSARFPYAAPTPGSSAFRSPQSPGAGGGVQTMSLIASLVLIAPAGWAATRWLAEGGAWAWVALALGFGFGLAGLVVGILVGGVSFDRRGPDLVDFAVRN